MSFRATGARAAGSNTFDGGPGNDTLAGSGAAEKMFGGAGSDRKSMARASSGLEDPAIASDSTGKLWFGWTQGNNVYVRRTNNGESVVGGERVSVPVPPGTTSIFDLKISAQDDRVDLVAVLDNNSGPPAIWHAQAFPGLELTANRHSFRGTERITFTVTDANEGVPGVTVRAGDRSGTTNEQGRVSLRLGPYNRRTELYATATKTRYTRDRLKLTAFPAR